MNFDQLGGVKISAFYENYIFMILPFFLLNGSVWNWVIVQEYISLVKAQDVKAEAERHASL